MPGERNPSTKHAIYDESQQSDLPRNNNIGRIEPLTEEPTPTGPSSVNEYRKFVKYAWMMALLLLVIMMVILLMINHKTFDHYPNLVELQSNLSVKCVGFILTLVCMAVGEKSSIWDALTNRASTVQKQKFDKYFSKNTPTTNSFFCGTYEILQVYRATVTKNSINADPIVPTEPSTEKSTSTINDNLEQQSESLHNNSTTYEVESNETRIGIPDLSEQVPTPNSSESSIYDEKQKFYKHIGRSVPTISVSFITVSLVFLCSSMQIEKHNLVRKILTCIGCLICFIGLFLVMHNWIKKPSPRTSKTQFIFMVFGVLLIVLFVVIAAVLIVSPDSLLEGAVWVVIMIIIIGLLGAFLMFTARQTEDNRQN